MKFLLLLLFILNKQCLSAVLPPLKMCFDNGQCLTRFHALQASLGDISAVQACHYNYTGLLIGGGTCTDGVYANATQLIVNYYMTSAARMWPWLQPASSRNVEYAAVYAYFCASMMNVAAQMNASGAHGIPLPSAL